jgi:hypothetical protein
MNQFDFKTPPKQPDERSLSSPETDHDTSAPTPTIFIPPTSSRSTVIFQFKKLRTNPKKIDFDSVMEQHREKIKQYFSKGSFQLKLLKTAPYLQFFS